MRTLERQHVFLCQPCRHGLAVLFGVVAIWRATADEDGHYSFAVALRVNAIKRARAARRPTEEPNLRHVSASPEAPCALGRVLTLAFWPVTRYIVTRYRGRNPMAAPAERMKMMRQRRRARGLRELRLVVADARSRAVRRRVAKQVAGLDPDRERDALQWIESVSEFDADATR